PNDVRHEARPRVDRAAAGRTEAGGEHVVAVGASIEFPCFTGNGDALASEVGDGAELRTAAPLAVDAVTYDDRRLGAVRDLGRERAALAASLHGHVPSSPQSNRTGPPAQVSGRAFVVPLRREGRVTRPSA